MELKWERKLYTGFVEKTVVMKRNCCLKFYSIDCCRADQMSYRTIKKP